MTRKPFSRFDAPRRRTLMLAATTALSLSAVWGLSACDQISDMTKPKAGLKFNGVDITGATYAQQLRYLVLPHLSRSIAVVVMIELIFLLSVFAEIYTTTAGGPGDASTNVAFLIFKQALLNFDAGVASAGALFAVVLANIAAAFLIRLVGKNLDK